MWEKELEIALLIRSLVSKAIDARMKAGNVSVGELPIYGAVVETCNGNVKYYSDLMEKEKEKCKDSSVSET
mgnify:FL=1